MKTKAPLPSRVSLRNDLSPSDAPLQQSPEGPDPIPWWQQPLHWWYHLTAPPEAPANASLAQREMARRGRLASVVLFFTILLVLPAFPTAMTNPVLLVTLTIVLCIDGVALLFNRLGQTTLAGTLVVIGVELGLGTSALTYAGGFGISNLPLLDLFVQAECVAVSLLVPESVFLVALVNCVFFVGMLTFGPITPELAHLLKSDSSRLVSQPITLQIIVAIVTYVWVRSATQAIVRADRAEEIAALEQRELERQEHEIEQKRQLDLGIQKILETHVEIAKGNFKARAPLAQDNLLWRIAYSLNNLLARLQRYSQLESEHQRLKAEYERLLGMLRDAPATAIVAERELQRTREAVALLLEAAQKAKNGQGLLWIPRTGTVVDALAQELAPFQPQAQRSVTQHRLD